MTVVGVERFQIQLKLEAAVKQRDALAKQERGAFEPSLKPVSRLPLSLPPIPAPNLPQIYNQLFDLLVAKMNQKIDTPKHMHKFIGLLDAFNPNPDPNPNLNPNPNPDPNLYPNPNPNP